MTGTSALEKSLAAAAKKASKAVTTTSTMVIRIYISNVSYFNFF